MVRRLSEIKGKEARMRLVRRARKDVNVRGVIVEDWQTLTEVAEQLDITMADLIHIVAVEMREKSSSESFFDFLVGQQERRSRFVNKMLSNRPLGRAILERANSPRDVCPKCDVPLTIAGDCPSCGLLPPEE
jgi:hypothetical protein